MDTRTIPVLSRRALGRATLSRQFLLTRADISAKEAVGHLLGLQAQNVKPPYFQLWSRIAGFDPQELSALMESRQVLRIVTMRSTIHTHTAEDAARLRPLVQPARDREIQNFRKGLEGVDLDRLARISRELVEAEPRTMAQLREELLKEWPDADPMSLSVAARCRLPLVQVTPRGVWGRSGQVRLTTLEKWVGEAATDASAAPEERSAASAASAASDASAAPAGTDVLDETVLRYLAAFGPASVKDMQTWSGLTRLRAAFDRLRPRLLVFRDEEGAELFDLPDAPRPDEDTPAPARFLPEFDNLLLSHADRSRIVPPESKGRTWRGNQAYCTFLLDGQLAGIWRLEQDKQRSELVIEAFGSITKGQREELAEEGGRMVREMTTAEHPSVRFGPVA
ncbi:winged helix DNA-binding domain-containing protein [Streptomyces sp. NBC_00239]|uniref:winged helix DNA-binding domain-containing protein n=1 Tax=Streptomyces sp. NBC_00239 TaxID=2903640 RepID=UPI002E2C0967|nr:winged helix DNA-binding domain-containing protein [Streptomyces sp. NBC_00239]